MTSPESLGQETHEQAVLDESTALCRWFGIDREHLPPDLYRLLGIERHADAEAVELGFQQRQAVLRKKFKDPQNKEVCTGLYRRIIAAKRCLLNAAERAKYDRGLQEGEEIQQETGGKRRTKSYTIAGIAGGVAVAASSLLYFWRGGDRENLPAPAPAAPATAQAPDLPPSVVPEKVEPAPAPKVNPPAKQKEPPAAPAPVVPKPAEPKPEPAPAVPAPAAVVPAVKPVEPAPVAAPAAKKVNGGKKALPSVEKRNQILADLQTDPAFGGEVAAQKLLEAGKNEKDPERQWCLLCESLRRAREARDIDTAFQVLHEMRSFAVDPAVLAQQRVDTAKGVLARGAKADEKAQGAPYVLSLMREAIDRDDYEAAARIGNELGNLLPRTAPQREEVKTLQATAKRLGGTYDQTEGAREALAANPDDPAACQRMGEFYCYAKGDWRRGLPLLAKSANEDLRDLAVRTAAAPTDAKTLLEIGKQWAAMGRGATNSHRTGMLQMAASCFQRVSARGNLALHQDAQQSLSGLGLRDLPPRVTLYPADFASSSDDWAQPIDLGTHLDPKKHTTEGGWSPFTMPVQGRSKGATPVAKGIVSEDAKTSSIFLPCDLRGDYVFRCQMVRLDTKGARNDMTHIVLPVGGRLISVFFELGWGVSSGMQRSDDPARPTPEFKDDRKQRIIQNQPFDLCVKVRQRGDQAFIEVECDGRLFVEWNGTVSSLHSASEAKYQDRATGEVQPGIAIEVNSSRMLVRNMSLERSRLSTVAETPKK
jgi:hypothetical protein